MKSLRAVDDTFDTVDFASAVLEGFRKQPKSVPSKFLYDRTGSELFERITELPEYYLAWKEWQLLKRHAAEMAAFIGSGAAVIEPGAGYGEKTRFLLRKLHQPEAYVAIDISRDALERSAARVRKEFPELSFTAIHGDFASSVDVPGFPGRKRVVFFPGSSIGNFEPREAEEFLGRQVRLLGGGGGLLIGFDCKKDPEILRRAYADSEGVTAAFNFNLLHRMNRELGADFRPERFAHRAVYNQALGRVEMYLVSLQPQIATIAGQSFLLRDGECVHTENSYKYGVEEFAVMAERAGFRPECRWQDEDGWYCLYYFTARQSRR